ncbi:hypothetical protein BDA99DRAFT_541034 [Phascolomyces articulosus]|uniref:Uncharacterized protein n=1 Tax=Phascolomyces articulosus TaxID=60185 RepID=A0AAD5JSF7_9FUNG|nr:hypothetical protein BDA99DRAFT_541034 [Phascolomyces articulosus]
MSMAKTRLTMTHKCTSSIIGINSMLHEHVSHEHVRKAIRKAVAYTTATAVSNVSVLCLLRTIRNKRTLGCQTEVYDCEVEYFIERATRISVQTKDCTTIAAGIKEFSVNFKNFWDGTAIYKRVERKTIHVFLRGATNIERIKKAKQAAAKKLQGVNRMQQSDNIDSPTSKILSRKQIKSKMQHKMPCWCQRDGTLTTPAHLTFNASTYTMLLKHLTPQLLIQFPTFRTQ